MYALRLFFETLKKNLLFQFIFKFYLVNESICLIHIFLHQNRLKSIILMFIFLIREKSNTFLTTLTLIFVTTKHYTQNFKNRHENNRY